MHKTAGAFLFSLELLYLTAWFIFVAIFNLNGGTSLLLEQGLFDCWYRVVALLALGILLHHHHTRGHVHWTSMMVINAVAAISCRGFIRYFLFYNDLAYAIGGHKVMLDVMLISSWVISMLEVIWVTSFGIMMVNWAGFRITIDLSWLFGATGSQKSYFPEYREEYEMNVFNQTDASIRSTPLVGLRQNNKQHGN